MMDDEDEDDDDMLGDVVVCPSVAEANAREHGHSLQRELETLTVHGILHLLGYDHQDAEGRRKMEARLEEVVSSFYVRR